MECWLWLHQVNRRHLQRPAIRCGHPILICGDRLSCVAVADDHDWGPELVKDGMWQHIDAEDTLWMNATESAARGMLRFMAVGEAPQDTVMHATSTNPAADAAVEESMLDVQEAQQHEKEEEGKEEDTAKEEHTAKEVDTIAPDEPMRANVGAAADDDGRRRGGLPSAMFSDRRTPSIDLSSILSVATIMAVLVTKSLIAASLLRPS